MPAMACDNHVVRFAFYGRTARTDAADTEAERLAALTGPRRRIDAFVTWDAAFCPYSQWRRGSALGAARR